jgi:ribosomal protein L21E
MNFLRVPACFLRLLLLGSRRSNGAAQRSNTVVSFMKNFGLGTEVRITHRFKIGDPIHVIGVLASFYSGKTGVVVDVEPNPEGIQELDRYVVEIPGVKIGDTKFADFQLAAAPHITRRAQLISN